MKQFIHKYGNCFSILEKRTYYKINYKTHGFFIFCGIFSETDYKKNSYKGYYNMGIEYSHWEKYGYKYIYFL